MIGEFLEFQLHLLVVLSLLINLPRFHFIYGKIMTPTLWISYEN